MASLQEIRDAFNTTIKTKSALQFSVYSMVEDIVQTPCVLIEPVAADFEGAMNEGMHTWDFNLFVLTANSSSRADGQRLLDKLISGPDSIPMILHKHADLGLADGTDAQCYMLKGYGGSFDWAKIPHVGAVLKVRVLTDPRW